MLKMSGRMLFASVLAAALAVPAFAEEEKKEEKKADAPAAAAGEIKAIADNVKAFKACVKDAKDKAGKKACKDTRIANRKAREAKIRDTKQAFKALRKEAKGMWKACKRAKNTDGAAKIKTWDKEAGKWWTSIKTWRKKGGEVKWDLPAKPEACAAVEKKEEKKE